MTTFFGNGILLFEVQLKKKIVLRSPNYFGMVLRERWCENSWKMNRRQNMEAIWRVQLCALLHPLSTLGLSW